MPTDSKSALRSQSGESPDIIFSPDVFGYHDLINTYTSRNKLQSSGHLRGQFPALPTAAKKKPSGLHVTFQEPGQEPGQEPEREQALIHPLFRKRHNSGKAGDVTPLDHRIAQMGGTTSSYEELPHRLEMSKKHKPLTPQERVIELTYEKSFLLQEMVYLKDTRAAELKFLNGVTKLRAGIETILADLDRILEERSRERTKAESDLFSYWGIDFDDGNVEDAVF